MIGGHTVTLPPRLLPTPRASLEAARLNVNNKKMAAKKEAIYLENAVAGLVVRAGVSGIFRMNHRFALTMMGYAPNHCAAGYERILRTVCLSDDEIEEAIHRADKRFNEEALRAAGNAIVPQVAYEIIRGIVEIERGEHFPDVRKEVDKV